MISFKFITVTRAQSISLPFLGLAACLCLTIPVSASQAADIAIMAEDAAQPFSGPDGKGYANDLVKAAFRAAGVDAALDVVPYARCKNEVEAGRVPACFGMSWYQGVEDNVVFSARPIFEVHADIFVHRDNASRIRAPGDIGKLSVLGIVNQYEYPESIYAMKKNGTALQTAPNDLANLKMLAAKRLDAAIVMTNDLEPIMQKAKSADVEDVVRFVFHGGTEKAYVGFSRKHPLGDWARQRFDAGFDKIIADGTVDAIRRKWTKASAP